MKSSLLIVIFGVGINCFAQCIPDSSTASPALLPDVVQKAINKLNDSGTNAPIKAGGIELTITHKFDPQISIIKELCRNSATCTNCGIYYSGVGSLNSSASVSGKIKDVSLTPVNETIFGYSLVIVLTASADLGATNTGSGGLDVTRDCSATNWSYDSVGTVQLNSTATGTTTGSGTLSTVSSTNSYSLSGTLTGTASQTLKWDLSAGTTEVTSGNLSCSTTVNIPNIGNYTIAGFSL